MEKKTDVGSGTGRGVRRIKIGAGGIVRNSRQVPFPLFLRVCYILRSVLFEICYAFG